MPYEPPSPPPPPSQPPPRATPPQQNEQQQQKHTASSQSRLAQWFTRPAQGGAPASNNGPPLPNSHNCAPPASASASTYVPGRMTSIPPPLPYGQANGHSHIKQQPRPQIPPQIPPARAAQIPLIPPIPQPQPQPAQSRPSQKSILPPSIPPRYSNGSGSGNGVRPAAQSFSAMDVDELATDYDDDDPVPLIISDLDPRFGQAPAMKSPSAPSKSLGTPSSLRQPVVSPRGDRSALFSPSHSKPNAHSLHPTTPRKSATVSVSIPSFSPSLSTTFSPENSKKKLSDLPTVRPPMPQAKTKPADTFRRTETVVNHVNPGGPPASSAATTAPAATAATAPAASSIVAAVERQIKGGRPKGWKPGMSYREVALRNLGIDINDPTLPAEFLLPLRDRRGGKIGRPRLDKPTSEIKKRIGRPPKTKETKETKLPKPPKPAATGRPMYGKRIGRPPLQTVEEVQRAIFQGSAVQFAAFKCEWAGCRAELQNLATLRRHVEFVHGRGGFVKKKKAAAKTPLPLTCRWRKCALREPPLVFASLQDFVQHTEYYHMEPLSWHQGDGVANSSHIGPPAAPTSIRLADKEAELHRLRQTEGEELDLDNTHNCATTAAPDMAIRVPAKHVPGYLKDGGQQVTPVLRDAFLEMSSAFWTAEEWGRRIKEVYRQQNKRPERGWTG